MGCLLSLPSASPPCHTCAKLALKSTAVPLLLGHEGPNPDLHPVLWFPPPAIFPPRLLSYSHGRWPRSMEHGQTLEVLLTSWGQCMFSPPVKPCPWQLLAGEAQGPAPPLLVADHSSGGGRKRDLHLIVCFVGSTSITPPGLVLSHPVSSSYMVKSKILTAERELFDPEG